MKSEEFYVPMRSKTEFWPVDMHSKIPLFTPLIFAMTTVCAIYVYNITFRTLYLLPRSSDALLPCQYVLILRDSDGALQERKTVM